MIQNLSLLGNYSVVLKQHCAAESQSNPGEMLRTPISFGLELLNMAFFSTPENIQSSAPLVSTGGIRQNLLLAIEWLDFGWFGP